MNQYLHYAALGCAVLICGLSAAVVLLVNFRAAAQGSRDVVEDTLKRQKNGLLNYNKIQTMLEQKGAAYLFGERATPLNYLLVCCVCAILGFAAVLSRGDWSPLHLLISTVVGVAAAYLPSLTLTLSDKSDNDELLEDLKSLYNTLRIEAHAGVYLTQALSECYLVVKNKRLKAALLDLTNDILAKSDVEAAVERFGGKFDNRYIDMFVVTIKQSLESGRSVQILEDVSTELQNVQKAIDTKMKERLDRKVEFLKLLAYVGIMAILLYTLVMSVANSVATL